MGENAHLVNATKDFPALDKLSRFAVSVGRFKFMLAHSF